MNDISDTKHKENSINDSYVNKKSRFSIPIVYRAITFLTLAVFADFSREQLFQTGIETKKTTNILDYVRMNRIFSTIGEDI